MLMVLSLATSWALPAALLDAQQQLRQTQAARALPADGKFFGLNVVQTEPWSGGWGDPAYTGNVSKHLLPGALRYPGGTVGNYWDWKKGWFRSDVKWNASAVPWYRDIPERPYRFQDFAVGLRATGATAVLSLNMLTSNLSYELAGLHAAAAAGIEVKYVELGNEFYLSQPDIIERFPSVAHYAREAETWARAVRAAFPAATVAAVGAYSQHAGGDARHTSWNAGLYASLPHDSATNALILHIYQGSGFGACAPVPGARRPPGAEGSWGSPGDQLRDYQSLRAPGGLDAMLAVPRRTLHNITDAWTAPQHLRLLVTEFNLFDRCGPVRLTWAHALYTALMAQRILAHKRIDLACYHALGGNPMFTALFTFNDTFAGLQLPGVHPPVTTVGTPSAPGLALSTLNRAASGAAFAHEVTAASSVGASLWSLATNVSGFVFTSADASAQGLWLINSGATTAQLTIQLRGVDTSTLRGVVAEEWSHPDPTAWLARPGEELSSRRAELTDTVHIAPYALLFTSGAS